MGLETVTYISDLVATNPAAGDNLSQADDHMRAMKSGLLNTFPGITGAVTATHTELNYVDGVTSAIQPQLDAKAPLASPTLTGTPAAPTAAYNTATTQIATMEAVGIGRMVQTGAGSTANPSAVAAVEFKNGTSGVVISSSYEMYLLEITALLPATDGVNLWLRTSTNAGSSYDSGASDYKHGTSVTQAGTTVTPAGSTADTKLVLNHTTATIGNASGEQGVYGLVWLFKPSAAAKLHAMWSLVYFDSSGIVNRCDGAGVRNTAADVDAIQLLFSSGNITSGTVRLYARTKQ